jgi:hypothetical protein
LLADKLPSDLDCPAYLLRGEAAFNERVRHADFHQVAKSEVNLIVPEVDLGLPKTLVMIAFEVMSPQPANNFRRANAEQPRRLRRRVKANSDQIISAEQVFTPIHYWHSPRFRASPQDSYHRRQKLVIPPITAKRSATDKLRELCADNIDDALVPDHVCDPALEPVFKSQRRSRRPSVCADGRRS